jgi:hypothetical protein
MGSLDILMVNIDTQILLLEQANQTKDVKEQIKKLQRIKAGYANHGKDYDPKTDWWPNKYPDM